MDQRISWDMYFMSIAKLVSTRSTCSSRPVGCILVKDNRILCTGYNGAPSGAPHCIDNNTEDKLFCSRREKQISDKDKFLTCPSIHAEENAILQAKKHKIDVHDATLYTTLSPCIHCINKLKEVNISRVYYELLYSSVNKERDVMWMQYAKSTFKVYEQLSLSHSVVQQVSDSLQKYSSERRMISE